ncbi:hypothetical protein SNE40_008696 [Patella caerulea]
MIKLLMCCICAVVYKQSSVDGLNSNLQITKGGQIASKLLLLQQLGSHYGDTEEGRKKLRGDRNRMVNNRLARKVDKYDDDEIETKIRNMLDTRDALDKLSYEIREVHGSKLGVVVQARNRMRRSVEAIMMQFGGHGSDKDNNKHQGWKLGRLR